MYAVPAWHHVVKQRRGMRRASRRRAPFALNSSPDLWFMGAPLLRSSKPPLVLRAGPAPVADAIHHILEGAVSQSDRRAVGDGSRFVL